MSAEVKKCPCCNAYAESDLAQGFIDWQGRAGKAVSIYCLACSINITLCYGDHPGATVEELYEMALNIWNRRATVSMETAQKLADALKPYAQYQFATKDDDSFVVRLPIHANRELIQKRVDEYNESSGASNLPDAVVLEVSEAAKALAQFEKEKGGSNTYATSQLRANEGSNQPYIFPTDITLPCIVSPKYDGIRVMNLGGDKWYTSKFKPIPSRQAREYLLTIKLEYVDAELLVFHEEDHKFLDYNDIQSWVMTEDSKLPSYLSYRLKVFDYFGDPAQPYTVRMELMKSRLDDYEVNWFVVKDTYVDDVFHLHVLCNELATHYEGAIIRNPQARYKFGRCTLREKIMWKYVLTQREEGIITGHTEHDIYPDLIGALVVNTDKWGTIKVSGRIDRSLSREFKQGKHIGRTITYEYKPHGMKDMPRQPRFVGFRDGGI